MIEQTEMIMTEWEYRLPWNTLDEESIESTIALEAMKKRNSIKKGIAFRFRVKFFTGEYVILNCAGEHSYVIDFEDVIDQNELLRMIDQSYLQFNELFNFRKLATIFRNKSLKQLDVSTIDVTNLLPMLE